MARPNPRLVAGVGLLTAVLVLGGSGGAQAFGHPGDRGDRNDRGNSSSERGCCRGGSDRDDDRGSGRGNGDDSFDRPGHGGNNGGATSKPGNGRNDDDSVTQDERQIPPLQQGSARVGTQRLAPADDAEAGDRDDSGDESETRSDSGSSGGSDRAADAAPGFKPPRVTVGNGRSPGIQERDREPRGGGDYSAPDPAPAPQPPPPPPSPAPPPAPSIVERIATPPVLSKQLGVAPASNWHGPLWGIAGLLLIPAAGAALGYRQARATHDVERLRGR